jgi:pimeloyl-ACP methyl ester carboxylesterase
VRSLSRRAVLLGGIGLTALGGAAGGYELVQDGTLPGKYTLARLDGACGSAPPAPSGPRPTRYRTSFRSAYRQREVQMVTLVPARAGSGIGLAVVIALHGAGSGAVDLASQLAPGMTAAGVSRFAMICVDGGQAYWHKRADGDDPISMIMHEVLPRARAAGLATGRIGIIGESMGGYGALLLAERLAAMPAAAQAAAVPAVAAVAAMSPAIFGSYADARAANRTAFDSQADFADNDVLGSLTALRGVPAWVACGADDPFGPEAALLCARLAATTGHAVPGGILPGCHDDPFWERNLPAALHFIGDHLS